MTKGRGAKVSVPSEPNAGMSSRDRLRALIQAEVARAGPAETARRSLELIVETSVRAREVNGELDVTVVDDAGQVRSRERDGRTVALTIADYIEELRLRHPTLFKSRAAPSPAPVQAEAASAVPAAAPLSRAAMQGSPEQASIGTQRDWLDLESDGPPAPATVAPAAVHQTVSDGKPPLGFAHRADKWTRFSDALAARIRAARATAGPLLTRSLGRFRESVEARRSAATWPLPPPVPTIRSRRWLPAVGVVASLAALVAAGALLAPSLMSPADAPASRAAAPSSSAAPAAAPADPATTGTVTSSPAVTASAEAGPLRGNPEVLDTATLRLQDRIVRLFGVEWARGGGDPDDLVKYLRGREISCVPAGPADSYRCQVEGQDLSRVVLFNGGGRTTSDATPELRAAEDHARSARIGVWKEGRAPGP